MTSLSLSDKDVTSLKVDALVVGVARGENGPVLVEGPALSKGLRSALSGALAGLGVTGAADEVTKVPSAGEAKAGVVVLSVWRDGSCVATMRVERCDVPALVNALVEGLALDGAPTPPPAAT